MQRFGGGPNSISHYAQYPSHSQGHASGLPPPSQIAGPAFMNLNSQLNPFSNGGSLSLGHGFNGGNGGGGGGGPIGVGANTGLASQAAQMGFAHGVQLQQQAYNGTGDQGGRGMGNKGRIREVWKSNLHEEMDTLRRLVDKYPYISMVSSFQSRVEARSLTVGRIQNSQALLLDQWVHFEERAITTIKH